MEFSTLVFEARSPVTVKIHCRENETPRPPDEIFKQNPDICFFEVHEEPLYYKNCWKIRFELGSFEGLRYRLVAQVCRDELDSCFWGSRLLNVLR